jgi:hypothetical protein
MTSPTDLHKPYTTGAQPKTGAEKASVEMTGSGWVRNITATQFAWAGNDNTSADPEILVAFRGAKHTAWFAYAFWYPLARTASGQGSSSGKQYSQAAPAAITVHVHFNEKVTVTGTPQLTITNDQAGGGSLASIVASYTAGTTTDRLTFVTAVPSANQFVSGNHMSLGVNCLALNGGTIKDTGSVVNAVIANSVSDKGNKGTYNKGGNVSHTNALYYDGSRVKWIA